MDTEQRRAQHPNDPAAVRRSLQGQVLVLRPAERRALLIDVERALLRLKPQQRRDHTT